MINRHKYSKYFKSTKGMTEVDVYAVHKIFEIDDPSGALQHASKKLLLSGVRTGGKSKFQDIQEARDTLNRWLELNANEDREASPQLQKTFEKISAEDFKPCPQKGSAA